MSVSPETNLAGPYVLTGSGQTLSVPFYFLEESHLLVFSRESTDDVVGEVLVLNSDYTVTGEGDEGGGSITMAAGVSGQIIVIFRNVPMNQIVNYIENDGFPADTHEQALDKATMQIQMLAERIERCLSLPRGEAGQVLGQLFTQYASVRAGKVLGADPDGNLVFGEIGEFSLSTISGAKILTESFVGSPFFVKKVLIPKDKQLLLTVYGSINARGYARVKTYLLTDIGGSLSVQEGVDDVYTGNQTGSEKLDFTVTVDAGGFLIKADTSLLVAERKLSIKWKAEAFDSVGGTTFVEIGF